MVGHIVLDRTQLPSPKRRQSPPQFSAHFNCGQTAGWIKMPTLDIEVGLGPGDFVLDGATPPQKEAEPGPPIFSPCLLWSNGCMDQDALGREMGLGLRDIVLDGDPSPLP